MFLNLIEILNFTLRDSINACIKNSTLYHDGTIQPRFLTINERVRQFGGHPSYAKFLMFMGLGLLGRERKILHFQKSNTRQFINIPQQIGGTEIVKEFEGITSNYRILIFLY